MERYKVGGKEVLISGSPFRSGEFLVNVNGRTVAVVNGRELGIVRLLVMSLGGERYG